MFRRLLVGLGAPALALALLLPLAGPASSSVTVREAWNFGPKGNLTLKGHGYGHGHGMSQYGAAGAARQGLTDREILSFYYPGTEVATFNSKVAVKISADTTEDTIVRWQSGLVAKDRGSGAKVTLPKLARVYRWRFVVKKGKTVLQFARDGRYYNYRVGGRVYLLGDGEFSSPIYRLGLVLPGGTVRQYRGVLRHARPSATSVRRDTVNVLSLDNYVRGVVPAEMPASWPAEAVQSQAIAARTYALFERQYNLKRHYQICDTTACQVYKGVAGEHPDANQAVKATARQYLTYDGKPAFTQFSASSGGWTSAGSQPYLVSKRDPYDNWSGNYVHNWTKTINRSTLQRRYPWLGTVVGLTVTRREGAGDWRGRVESITVRGTKDTKVLSGNDFRFVYGLRSTYFTRA